MSKSSYNTEYREGVKDFLDFAFQNASRDAKILCPCINCVNRYLQTYEEARVHLICDGFLSGYTHWICHGEKSSIDVSSSSYSLATTHPCTVQQN